MSRPENELLKICPRFRLLVIGSSGVGKSTLIQRVFGVDDVVSKDTRGRAVIEQEFVARENELFVVHDSLGLDAGDGDNFDTIKRFIRQRRAMTDIKDRLHAVWVLLSIPLAGGRLIESGMEHFLTERKEILGDIPMVIVLTKYDLLHQMLLVEMLEKGATKSPEEELAMVGQAKTKFLDDYCTRPLRVVAGDIPHVAVSAHDEFEATISELVKTTISEIERSIRADTSYLERSSPLHVANLAMRVAIEDKARLTVGLATERYRRSLGMSLTLSSKKISAYLLDIHLIAIQIWNFNDPDGVLQRDDFKAALLDDSHLGVDDNTNPGFLNSRHDMVKRFMAYFTDLIYVMRILSTWSLGSPITVEEVALSLKIYKSAYRNRVHVEIRDSIPNSVVPPGRDTVIEKIEEMTRRYTITETDVTELRRQVRDETDGSKEQSNPPATRQVASEEESDPPAITQVASQNESDLPLLQQVGGRTMTMFMVLWSA